MTTYTYTTLSDPSAAPGGYTVPVSINDSGQLVGNYFDGTAEAGFLYSNGTWTTLHDPSAASPPGGIGTVPAAINESGQITGFDGAGFLYSNGIWTTLHDPSLPADGFTGPTAINDKGQVTGCRKDNGHTSTDVGFLDSNGTWTTLSDPLVSASGRTEAFSINDRGQVDGIYATTGTAVADGFLDSNGTWTTLRDPWRLRLRVAYPLSTKPSMIWDKSPATTYNGMEHRRFSLQQRHLDHPE